MILEEILGIFISLLPKFTLATQPRQLEIQNEEASTSSQQQLVGIQEEDRSATEETQEIEQQWDEINKEYESEDENHSSQSGANDSSLESYASLGDKLTVNRTLRQSLRRSLLANLGIMCAAFLLALLAIVFACFEITRLVVCRSKSDIFGDSKWELISDEIEDVFLNLWFPATMVLLFGWTEFKKYYLSTFYIGCAVGATATIYKSYLFIFHIYTSKPGLATLGDAMFIIAIIFNSFVVARNFCRFHPSRIHRWIHIFAVIIVQCIPAIAIAWIYRLVFVPLLNGIENDIHRALFSTTLVLAALIPSAICNYVAVEQSPGIVNPERRFLLAYIIREAPVAIYRMMQADFKMIWLYIGFSILHGFADIITKVTQNLREKMWTRLVRHLNNTSCCRRLELLPYNSPRLRRYDVDLEIQDMLFQYNVIILSQGYLALYQLTSLQVSLGTVLKDSFIRITIGLGIEFISNYVSIFIQIHFYNLPIRRVWFKHWKRHVIANVILTMAMVLYFSPALFAIYQARPNDPSGNVTITNCTLPF